MAVYTLGDAISQSPNAVHIHNTPNQTKHQVPLIKFDSFLFGRLFIITNIDVYLTWVTNETSNDQNMDHGCAIFGDIVFTQSTATQ